jgi:general secretion pathway protein C
MLHGLIHGELTPKVGIEIVKKFAFAAVHLVFFVALMAIVGYWGIRIFTPSPLAAPPPLPPPPLRDPDPVAAARMFGKVDVVQSVASNVQAVGVFAAGKDSSAVLIVDGKPARAFVIGQEVAPGMKLVSVTPELAILETTGGRQEVRMPAQPIAQLGGFPAAPNFFREGNTLTAPSSDGAPNIPRPVPMQTPRAAAPQPPPQFPTQQVPPQMQQQVPQQPQPMPQQQVPQQQVPQQQMPQQQIPQPIIPGGVQPQSQ